MGTALSIFVILSFSVLAIRVASVALRITGLPEHSARFQALSAFTGTGFTTSEAESIVNYPIRRRVVSILMIVGNLGLASVFATVVVSFVQADGEPGAVFSQVLWIIVGLGLIWFLMLNATADRLLCSLLSRVLESFTFLGSRAFHRLAQLDSGLSVCEHKIPSRWLVHPAELQVLIDQQMLQILGSRSLEGGRFTMGKEVQPNSTLLLMGADDAHETLADCLEQVDVE